jgi:hypothetical protein
MPAPSYATEVAPLLARTCLPACHGAGGVEQTKPIGTYAQVFSRRGLMLTQVNNCRMPPPDAGVLSDQEASMLLDWLVCGAPNN